MTRRLLEIPHIDSYDDIRRMMREDLEYRLQSRVARTSLGRPLYYHINVQIIMTQECPYSCPFCLERQNPMEGEQDFASQLSSLKDVIMEHPNARITTTGGEPGLYPSHIVDIQDTYERGNNEFMCVNTSGIDEMQGYRGHINLSYNDYVRPDYARFAGRPLTLQTVFDDEHMTIENIKKFIDEHGMDGMGYSFRFMSHIDKHEYPIDIWHQIKDSDEIDDIRFRVGDFFVYAYFKYRDSNVRITLGDMWQQQHNNYGDGYSNVIIHPDGSIGTNWR